jgi:hypothetical protein
MTLGQGANYGRWRNHPEAEGRVSRYGEAPTMPDIDPAHPDAPRERPRWAMRLLLRAMGR